MLPPSTPLALRRQATVSDVSPTSSSAMSGYNYNYATQPSSPRRSGSAQSPREKQAFGRGPMFQRKEMKKQDNDGAVAKKSNIVFQAKPSLIQMIETGKVCFFDYLTPYSPTTLKQFCFIRLADDPSSCLTDRSIWVYECYAEMFWKTEIQPSASMRRVRRAATSNSLTVSRDRSNATIKKDYFQNSFKLGFCYLLYHFLGSTSKNRETKAAELFSVMNATHGVRERSSTFGPFLPSSHNLSSGQRGYLLYEGAKKCRMDFLDVKIVESSVSEPFVVELCMRMRPPNKENESCSKRHGQIVTSQQFEKYQKTHYYQISQGDIRALIFDKDVYCSEEFGRSVGHEDKNFFVRLIDGLAYDSDTNSICLDFIENIKTARFYREEISNGEKSMISRVYDDRKMESVMRKVVSKLKEINRVENENLPDAEEALTSLMSNYIKDDSARSCRPNGGRKEELPFDVDVLMLPKHSDVESAFVSTFNRRVVESQMKMEEEQKVRMEVYMRRFALLKVEDMTTEEDSCLFDGIDMPLFSSFSARSSKYLHALVSRSTPPTVAQIRDALLTPARKRTRAMTSNIINMLLRTKHLASCLTVCTEQSLRHMANACSFVHLPEVGSVLASEGEYFDCCFIVLSGRLQISKPKSKKGKPEGHPSQLKRVPSKEVAFASRGQFVARDATRGRHCWREDVLSASEGTSVCLIPVQTIRKHVGVGGAASHNFIKCFWKHLQVWRDAETSPVKDKSVHFNDGLSNKLKHLDSSSYFFSECSTDMNSTTLDSSSPSESQVASVNDVREWLTRRARVRSYRPGEIIFQQDSESHLLHVVVLGECLHVRRLPTATDLHVEVDIGLNLYPGHFVLDVSSSPVNAEEGPSGCLQKTSDVPSKTHDWINSNEHNDRKKTIMNDQVFSFSVMSSDVQSDEVEEEKNTQLPREIGRTNKRGAVFEKKTFLTSLVDQDFALTAAEYGKHSNSLISKTYCEVCVLPLMDILKCPSNIFNALFSKFQEKYGRAMISNEKLEIMYEESLKKKISWIQNKIEVLAEYVEQRGNHSSKGNIYTTNISRLKKDLEKAQHDLDVLNKSQQRYGKSRHA